MRAKHPRSQTIDVLETAKRIEEELGKRHARCDACDGLFPKRLVDFCASCQRFECDWCWHWSHYDLSQGLPERLERP